MSDPQGQRDGSKKRVWPTVGIQLRMDKQWPPLPEMDVHRRPLGLVVTRGPRAGSGTEQPPSEAGQ